MGQVVLITGASSGIGYATALAFAKRGAHVAVTARRADRLAKLVAEIATLPSPHGDCLTITADVTDASAMQAAVDQTIQRFGRLDVLVANAGIGQRGSLVDSDWDDLETLLRTNIDGVLHSIRAAVPAMRQSSGEPLGEPLGGHIVIVSSVVANMVSPYAATYSASKAFVSSIAHSLRFELMPDHITVTDLIVGRTETEFSQRRLGMMGHADKAPKIPVMSAEQVAEGIVQATERRSSRAILRLFDRLVVLGNALVPDFIGRRAMRQYRT